MLCTENCQVGRSNGVVVVDVAKSCSRAPPFENSPLIGCQSRNTFTWLLSTSSSSIFSSSVDSTCTEPQHSTWWWGWCGGIRGRGELFRLSETVMRREEKIKVTGCEKTLTTYKHNIIAHYATLRPRTACGAYRLYPPDWLHQLWWTAKDSRST